jgi:hypothetical protein
MEANKAAAALAHERRSQVYADLAAEYWNSPNKNSRKRKRASNKPSKQTKSKRRKILAENVWDLVAESATKLNFTREEVVVSVVKTLQQGFPDLVKVNLFSLWG